jgi:hypothetical protein
MLSFAALILGAGSALAAIHHVTRAGTIRVGPWATSTTTGSTSAGLYERAAIAVHALFVLNRTETVYFRAYSDDRGTLLDGACEYEIKGRPLSARWWSVTAYGADDYLIPNPANRYSFTMKNLTYEPDGSFIVRAGRTTQPGNWLPLESGHPSFVLRLYNPDARIAADPATAVLPTIRTVACP